jgi:hypothetical protein
MNAQLAVASYSRKRYSNGRRLYLGEIAVLAGKVTGRVELPFRPPQVFAAQQRRVEIRRPGVKPAQVSTPGGWKVVEHLLDFLVNLRLSFSGFGETVSFMNPSERPVVRKMDRVIVVALCEARTSPSFCRATSNGRHYRASLRACNFRRRTQNRKPIPRTTPSKTTS